MRPFLQLVLAFALTTLGAFSQMNHTADKTSLHALIDTQTAAWNQGDATTWAASFTGDAGFINIRGDLFQGRAEITQRHASIFAGPYKGSHAAVTIGKITFPAPTIALIETVHEVTGFHVLPPGILATSEGVLRTRMNYVAESSGGVWHFVAAQNTAILPPPPQR